MWKWIFNKNFRTNSYNNKRKRKIWTWAKKNNSEKIIEGCECNTEENKRWKKFSVYFFLDCLKFIC